MRIFEFQFNPKAHKDRFFRVFPGEPPKGTEEFGSLYLMGELANAIPANADFLDRLFNVISQTYYASDQQAQSTSQRLKGALKKANEFLTEESKQGNVDWLGNLHVLVLLLAPAGDGYALYFAKAGRTQLWMARSGSLVDAGKSVERRAENEGSLKVFGSVGSGRAIPGDRIMGLTEDVFAFFSKENFLQTVAQLKEEKQFHHLFKTKHKEMDSLAGILFFVFVEAPAKVQEKAKGEPARAGGSRLKIPFLAGLPAQVGVPRFSLPALPRPRFNPALLAMLRPPAVSLPLLPGASSLKKKILFFLASAAKRRAGLLALFLLVLLLGFAILGGEPRRGSDASDRQSSQVGPTEISAEQRALYNVREIAEPDVVFELPANFAAENPQYMIQMSSRFYFFGPASPKILIFDGEINTFESVTVGKNLAFGTAFGDSLLFFAEPDTILSFSTFTNAVVFRPAVSFLPEAQLKGMEQYGGNLYFFDARSGDIFRFSISQNSPTAAASWLDPLSSKKPVNAQAMGIDGNIWILTQDNEIQRYFRGSYEESLRPDIFPVFRAVRLLKTSSQLPYLYLLEPAEWRAVILSKSGQVVLQYRSSVFANVRDFSVSADGQTMYFFDGAKLYRISVEII